MKLKGGQESVQLFGTPCIHSRFLHHGFMGVPRGLLLSFQGSLQTSDEPGHLSDGVRWFNLLSQPGKLSKECSNAKNVLNRMTKSHSDRVHHWSYSDSASMTQHASPCPVECWSSLVDSHLISCGCQRSHPSLSSLLLPNPSSIRVFHYQPFKKAPKYEFQFSAMASIPQQLRESISLERTTDLLAVQRDCVFNTRVLGAITFKIVPSSVQFHPYSDCTEKSRWLQEKVARQTLTLAIRN